MCQSGKLERRTLQRARADFTAIGHDPPYNNLDNSLYLLGDLQVLSHLSPLERTHTFLPLPKNCKIITFSLNRSALLGTPPAGFLPYN